MDAVAAFLDYLRYEKRVSENTIIAYAHDLSQLEEFVQASEGDVSLLALSPLVIRNWIFDLLETGDRIVGTRSVNRKISTLKSFYQFHQKRGNIVQNPMSRVVSPKTKKRLPTYVPEEKMERLFHAELFANDFEGWRDRAIIELFYATGMRLSELLNIKMGDIDFQQQSVKVLGKRNKERVIPFGNIVKEVIINYLDFFEKKFGEPTKNSFIFVTAKHTKMYPKAVYRIVHKYLDMVTTIEKRSPHVIRHTFATHLLNHGADINAIKEILGHSSLAATQVYTHNSIEKLKNIYKQAHPRA